MINIKNMFKKFLLIAFLSLFALNSANASSTLYEYYTLRNEKLPSISERAPLWVNISDTRYIGSQEQNESLLDYLEEPKEEYLDLFTIFQTFGLPMNEENLGGNIPITATNWNLAIPHDSSDTTIDLPNFNDLRGNAITSTSTFPDKIYLVLEPENTDNTEIAVCPNSGVDITNTQFTGCTRGLSFTGTSEASVTANKKDHPSGARVIMTNVGQFFNNFVNTQDAQDIDGVKNFIVRPTTSTSTPTALGQVATMYDLSTATTTGGLIATEAIRGTSQLATQAEMTAGTFDASNPAVLYTNYSNATSTATTTIPITKTNGKLSQGFLDLTESFSLTDNLAVTGTTTLATTTIIDLTVSGTSTLQTTTIGGVGANQLTDGSDVIIHGHDNSSKKVFIDLVQKDYTDSTAQNVICSSTIPAGILSTDRALKTTLLLSNIGTNGGTNNPVIRFKYGGSTVITNTVSIGTGLADKMKIEAYLFANASTTAQIGRMWTDGSDIQLTTMTSGSSAQDSTGALDLQITTQLSDSGSDVVADMCTIELISN